MSRFSFRAPRITAALSLCSLTLAMSGAHAALPASNPATPPAAAARPATTIDANSSRAGATAGEFRVDESGSANYRIPILTAPGSGGVAPEIGLSYNHQSGNGLLGVGWTIDGLSAIARCSQTLDQDGSSAVRGISLTATDRFCLDGQRLMVTSGSYGANGAQYRTEIDGIARITSFGTAGTGPAYFEVKRKDGSTSWYGNTTNSRIEGRTATDTTTAFTWALNRYQDSAGNYIDFSYTENASGPVEFVIAKISYTGNAAAGVTPFAELNFVYDTARTDIAKGNFAGISFETRKRLTQVHSKAKIKSTDTAMSWLRAYFLDYGATNTEVDGFGRSILTAVQECANTTRTGTTAYCMPSTQFTWLKSDHAISAVNYTGPALPAVIYDIQTGDFNADGRNDVVYVEKVSSTYYFRVVHANASGGFNAATSAYVIPTASNGSPARLMVVDYNGDGLQDVVYGKTVSSVTSWYGRRAYTTSFGIEEKVGSSTSGLIAPVFGQVMDYNGDGLGDLVYSSSSSTSSNLRVSVANKFNAASVATTFQAPVTLNFDTNNVFPFMVPSSGGNWFMDDLSGTGITIRSDKTRVFDFDGDGRTDILVNLMATYCQGMCDGGDFPLMTPPESVQFPPEEGSEPATEALEAGTYTLLTEAEFLAQSEDSAATEPVMLDPATGLPVTNLGGGFVPTATASLWVIYRATGSNFYSSNQVVAKSTACAPYELCSGTYASAPAVSGLNIWPADVSGDGLADIVYAKGSSASPMAYRVNTGGRMSTTESTMPSIPSDRLSYIQFADYTGDGLPDLLYPSAIGSATAKWNMLENVVGGGFAAAITLTIGSGNVNVDKDLSLFSDFTGDGKLDQLFLDYSGTSIIARYLRRGSNGLSGNLANEPSNVISSITTGLGAVTKFSYKPLTDATVYTRMNNAMSATTQWGRGVVFDLAAPIYVLAKAESSAPTFSSATALSHVEYAYAGAKVQGNGRGFLGFGEVISYDPQSCIRTNTVYRQDFPYIGMPAETWQVKVPCGNATYKLKPVSSTGTVMPSWPAVLFTTPLPSALTTSEFVVNYARNDWTKLTTGTGVSFPYIRASMERSYTLQETFSHKVLSLHTYDSYGNPSRTENRHYDTDTTTDDPLATLVTVNVYDENNGDADDATWVSKWFLGRLDTATVTHGRRGKTAITRRAGFTYNTTTGLLATEVSEPGSATHQVTTSYVRDVFGNATQTTVTGIGMSGRVSSVVYEPLGRLIIQNKNAYNQITQSMTDWDVQGNPKLVNDINDVFTETYYDHLGRPFLTYKESGAWNKTLFSTAAVSQCPGGTTFHSLTTGGGSPTRYECFDRLGRAIRTATQGFAGVYVNVDSYYDAAGRVARISEPYYVGQTAYWNTTSYDELGRPLVVDSADGNDLLYAYDASASNGCSIAATPRLTRITNGLGQERLEKTTALGEISDIYDELCGRVQYDYDAVGNVTRITGADNVVTTLGYDAVAMYKVATNDPDKGNWQYRYNPLGEMTRQRDPKSQSTDYVYDNMGRVTQRLDLTGVTTLTTAGTVVQNTVLVYQNSPTATLGTRGQLLSDTLRLGSATSGTAAHGKTHAYDSLGRSRLITTTMGSLVVSEESTYDQFGRPFQSFDGAGDDFGLQYLYNSYGYLYRLKEARDQVSGVIYQETKAMDARGNITHALLGNGVNAYASYEAASGRLDTMTAFKGTVELQNLDYLFDVMGNLKQRWDRSGSKDLKEDYTFDGLNRLTTVKLTAPALGITTPATTMSLSYNAAGNILSKTGVGSYTYGSLTVRPHAVTAAGGQTYTYDANGNQTAGDGRTISYTTADQASVITKGSHRVEFSYGSDRERYKRIDKLNSAITSTTYYVGNVEIIYQGSTEERRRELGYALHHYFPNTSVVRTDYLLRDHLGSVDVVLDQSGLLVDEASFDAFGNRRDPGDWRINMAGINPLAGISNRGYTGHEQVDTTGVVHMNGRIYDPRLGRFLQADPFVQAPDNSQSLNRYSYVLNNPVSYTDPSGYFFKKLFKLFKKALKIIAIAVISYYTFGAASGLIAGWGIAAVGTVGNAVLAGAMAGFVTGAVTTGSLKGALIGAFAGAAFGGIAATNWSNVVKTLADGVAGGVTAELSGGKFGHGFLSAGLTQAFSVKISQIKSAVGRVAATALVGGTASRLGGGKFANGAATSAFQYTVNVSISGAGQSAGSSAGSGNQQPSFGRRLIMGTLDVIGKIWALPNTVVGLVIGLAGVPFGAKITFGNNGIQFENYPWGDSNAALTLGNVIIYGKNTSPADFGSLYGSTQFLNVGRHEKGHTLQYQFFGPLFLPTYLLSGGISASNPFEQGANNYAGGGSWWPRKK